jgi:hypothetical protein
MKIKKGGGITLSFTSPDKGKMIFYIYEVFTSPEKGKRPNGPFLYLRNTA